MTLEKDLGDGTGFVPAAGEHVDCHADGLERRDVRRPTGPCTGDDERDARPVHDHVHVDTGGQGDRARVVDAVGRRLGAVHGRRPTAVAPNSRRRGEDVRGREHPDHAERREPGRSDAHTFTAHVNVERRRRDGFVNAPDGTPISFTIDSGPGGFTTPNPCTTAGGTGSCTITLSSAVTGVTTVSRRTRR